MSRTISAAGRADVFAAQTQAAFFVLLVVDHAALGAPLYFINDRVSHGIAGTNYVAYPFQMEPPADKDDLNASAKITIDNVDRQIIIALRTILENYDEQPTVTASIVRMNNEGCIEDQLVHWSFEAQETGEYIDQSGNGIDGAITGAVAVVTGASGNGADVSADGKYVVHANFSLPAVFTALVWAKAKSALVDSAGGLVWCVDGTLTDAGTGFWIIWNPGPSPLVSFAINDGAGTSLYDTTMTPPDDGEWHLFSIRVSAASMIIGIDDTFKTVANTQGSCAVVADLKCGDHPSAGAYFNGYVDEMRVISRALSDEEIEWLFANPEGPITTEWGPVEFKLRNAKYTAFKITADLIFEDRTDFDFPKHLMSPNNVPGVF